MMFEYQKTKDLQAKIDELKMEDKTVGFVPTMGALHKGHMQLVKQAREQNDVCVVSIFVNPLQFDRAEDLEKYPRTLEKDAELLRKNGAKILFAPTVEEMYPEPTSVNISFGRMAEVLEGKYRTGHFEGVGVVVSKLLNMVSPHRAYFGLKDLQQYMLIKKMCADLSFPLEIIGVDIVREESGLAFSSRNARLSENGLEIGAKISEGLRKIQNQLINKENISKIKKEALDFYQSVDGMEVEYLEFVNGDNLEEIQEYPAHGKIAVCIAAYVEGVRLIDNIFLQ